MIRSKKGFAFIALMVVATIVLLLSVITVVLMKENKFNFKKIGDLQLNAIQSYQNAEKTLFIIDQAAKYSAYATIHELAEGGGRYRVQSGCGDYLGYSILYDTGKKCYPENINEEFLLTYNKNLNQMLTGITNPDSFVYTIISANPLQIAGTNREMLEFPISYTTEKVIEKKTICPDVELKTIPSDIVCSATQSHCSLKPEVVAKLQEAQTIAKNKGFELEVTSGYRTIVQQAALKAAKGELAAGAGCTAPHVTGGAVDVVLRGRPYMIGKGNVANMNLGERKILEEIMCEAGFVRYGNKEGTKGEFWHYEYGTKRWERGKAAGVCAII